jgi:hypothetical protein
MRRQFTTQFEAQVARELLRDNKTIAQIANPGPLGKESLELHVDATFRVRDHLLEKVRGLEIGSHGTCVCSL